MTKLNWRSWTAIGLFSYLGYSMMDTFMWGLFGIIHGESASWYLMGVMLGVSITMIVSLILLGSKFQWNSADLIELYQSGDAQFAIISSVIMLLPGSILAFMGSYILDDLYWGYILGAMSGIGLPVCLFFTLFPLFEPDAR